MKSGIAQSKAISNPASNPAPFKLKSKPGNKVKDRHTRISISAYYKAEARGFSPEYVLEDWLTAEAEEQ
jgi:hypothetical protein